MSGNTLTAENSISIQKYEEEIRTVLEEEYDIGDTFDSLEIASKTSLSSHEVGQALGSAKNGVEGLGYADPVHNQWKIMSSALNYDESLTEEDQPSFDRDLFGLEDLETQIDLILERDGFVDKETMRNYFRRYTRIFDQGVNSTVGVHRRAGSYLENYVESRELDEEHNKWVL